MKSAGWKLIEESLRKGLFGEAPIVRDAFVGLWDIDGLAKRRREEREFLYFDNAYFKRGARSSNFRLIRNGLHLTEVLERPADRLARFNVNPKPWKKTGRNVIVIPPSPWHVQLYGGFPIPAIPTDRPVIVKHDKKIPPLVELLEDAWCVVTCSGSVAGVEALLAGVPVFSGAICPTLPMTSGSLENIETPLYPDRHPWLCSLSYASWNMDEIHQLDLKDYRYQCAL